MKYIKFKIREHFLELIREGKKKHEYRLANSKNANINVGDVLILISNQNPYNYVKVIVDSIKKYSNWDEALNNSWKNDFGNLFSTYQDVLKECYRFYPKDEVEKYGIEVFDIRLFSKSTSKARYLFDTNFIIERESYNNVSKEVSLCCSTIDKLHGEKFIHDYTVEEIKKYENKKIRDTLLIKINSYQRLISRTEKTKFYDEVCSKFSQDENSKIDNEILLQVFNGNVDFLITSDITILNKAKMLYLNDAVFTPYDFLQKIEKENPSLIEYNVLSIELVNIGTLNINDSFFNSLREDYEGAKFNDWLMKKSNEKAYVFRNNDGIQGFLYLKTEGKEENYSYFSPKLEPAIRLKVGTFKISKSGLRLGERFLKIIFDNAIKRNVDEIYVTLFENKREEVTRLKLMMEEWGFVKKAVNIKNGESVLVKSMKLYDDLKTPKYNYPLCKSNKRYMVLPIISKYHTKLFPDLHLKNENMKVYDEEACRYAIEKIYVSGWKKIDAKPGDLLCIYRMGDYRKLYTSVVTGTAILNEVCYPTNEEEFVKTCKNKSVFSEKELKKFYEEGKYRTIIKVLFLNSFTNKINLNTLNEYGIINKDGPGPRINTFINEKKFNELVKLGRKEINNE